MTATTRLSPTQRAVLERMAAGGVLMHGWRGEWWFGPWNNVGRVTAEILRDRGLIAGTPERGSSPPRERYRITTAGRAALEAS